MKKYWSIFAISFQEEFAYKMNFIMWRVRNVIQILITYFLWISVFNDPQTSIFGYNQAAILTYVFGIILIRAMVFSARSVDVPGEISEGLLTNYLVRPIKFFKYWFARDTASKALNFMFSIVEFSILSVLFKPSLIFQTNATYLLLFVASLIVANYLIFVIRFLVTSVTFWVPEMGWGGQFLFMVIITEFLSGSVFPLDIFPLVWQKAFYFTPFPYLVFFPLQVYLGKIPVSLAVNGLVVSILWSVVLSYLLKYVWQKGLKLYGAEGR